MSSRELDRRRSCVLAVMVAVGLAVGLAACGGTAGSGAASPSGSPPGSSAGSTAAATPGSAAATPGSAAGSPPGSTAGIGPGASVDGVPAPTSDRSTVVRAEAAEGRFRLVFELEDDEFAVDEPIDGRAWLEVGGEPVELWASGSGLVLFDLREIGGTRGMGGATSDCRAYNVTGRTEPTAIRKAGGWSADDPDAGWYIAFFNDPLLRLPAGRWEIAASASFTVGECGGASVELRAPITITVGS